jgi:Stress responsive A/B Barrel Domain
MIRHAAIFRLKHAKGSAEEKSFLAAQAELATIPGVENFEIAWETSPKNSFDYAVSMTFADQAAYDGYNAHPLHVAFVRDRWIPEVAAFMEHDTLKMA